jgi:ketosteroid isomerase-like protein
MSQENVEIVRSIYEALNRGDWEAAIRPTDAEFEVTFQRGPNAGTHRGRDAIGESSKISERHSTHGSSRWRKCSTSVIKWWR